MQHDNCQNCSEMISGNFCSNCGQKTDTHRIVLKHFILHDMLHGVWHLEKGILFTLKETIIRPGQAALDYIGGKRIRYYNVFYLSLLMIGANLLLAHLLDAIHPEIESLESDKFVALLSENLKIFIFCIVPILALNAKFFFKRLQLNIAEHFIIAGIALLGMLMVTTVYLILDFLGYYRIYFLGILEIISFLMIPLFPFWTYRNATKKHYRFWGSIWRVTAFMLLIFIEIIFMLLVASTFINGRPQIGINF